MDHLLEYDAEAHPAEEFGPEATEHPDGYTYEDALADAIAAIEARDGLARRVVHPDDTRAGPTADRPVVNLGR